MSKNKSQTYRGLTLKRRVGKDAQLERTKTCNHATPCSLGASQYHEDKYSVEVILQTTYGFPENFNCLKSYAITRAKAF